MTSEAIERELRELVVRYAHLADRRDGAAVSRLFTEDGVLAIFSAPENGGAGDGILRRQSTGRDEITTAMSMDRYLATSHVVAQSIFDQAADEATGETYCLAYQLYRDGQERRRRTLAIRYLDTFVNGPDGWRIRERKLLMDWAEDAVSSDGTDRPT